MISGRLIGRFIRLNRRSVIGSKQAFVVLRPISSQNSVTPLNGDHQTRRIYFINHKTQFQPRRYYADYPSHTVIKLPNLSPTMTTGTVVSWAKSEGDEIEEGDLMAEIETDKATMSLDASDAGFLAKIISAAGTKDIPVGTPLCVVVEEAGDVAAFKDFVADVSAGQSKPAESTPPPPAAAPPSPPVPSAPTPSAPAPPTAPSAGRVFASPLAKTLASQNAVDLGMVSGSGPEGRIRAGDVSAFLDRQAFAPSAAAPSAAPVAAVSDAEYIDIPLTNMRSVIAQRLTQSKQSIPHYYLTVDVQMDKIVKLRGEVNDRLKKNKSDTKLSVNDFVIKAAAMACKKVPEVNSSWQETFIRQYNQVDVSVAVATPEGLITPIVKGAERLGLVDLNATVIELAEKARNKKLKPHEFQGGTFTISNLGMFGIKSFTAIINPPQACILAVGGAEKRLVPCDVSDNGMKTVPIMSVTLCCDHRVVDGAVGARWLARFKEHLEDPFSMLL